jgi:hypothetical protein
MRASSGEPGIVEPCGVGPRERLVGQVCERGPTPERQRLGQPGGISTRDQDVKALDVELARIDSEQVAGRPRLDPIRTERLAHGMHVNLKRALSARGRRFAPDAVDQPIRRDNGVRLEEQSRQQRARPATAQRHGHAVVADHLQRPQEPEFHRPPSLPAPRLYGRAEPIQGKCHVGGDRRASIGLLVARRP